MFHFFVVGLCRMASSSIQSLTEYSFRTLAQLLRLPPSVDVLFFGGQGSYLLLHALHVAMAEFDDAGYLVVISDSAAVDVERVAAYLEHLELSSCDPALLFRPHTLDGAILKDPVFANSNQSSLSAAAFASIDDGFLVTRASVEAMLAERRRWSQVTAATSAQLPVLILTAACPCVGCWELLFRAGAE
jgi:hypothetical protein